MECLDNRGPRFHCSTTSNTIPLIALFHGFWVNLKKGTTIRYTKLGETDVQSHMCTYYDVYGTAQMQRRTLASKLIVSA